jgi:hypothetical protein
MISSHTGFQPLKTVWLGDVYPPHFYNHLSTELQDSLGQLTETTKHDLAQIEKKLVELGIKVQRPEFKNVDLYMSDDKLTKPPICPRDWACTLGDTLYITPQYESKIEPWQWAIDQYKKDNQKVRILNRFSDDPDPWCYAEFPAVVRVGRDVYIDYPIHHQSKLESVCKELSEKYRVHVTHTGDHSDGVFCPVKPGQIFSTHYRKKYSDTFPGWDVFFLKDTTRNSGYGQWYRSEHYLPYYSDALFQYATKWAGNARETVFEVNMLVVDDKNIICIAENDLACRKLEEIGITPHVVNFKTRGFWDGGLHCITLDIHREGECLDYWPNRGENGVYYYT